MVTVSTQGQQLFYTEFNTHRFLVCVCPLHERNYLYGSSQHHATWNHHGNTFLGVSMRVSPEGLHWAGGPALRPLHWAQQNEKDGLEHNASIHSLCFLTEEAPWLGPPLRLTWRGWHTQRRAGARWAVWSDGEAAAAASWRRSTFMCSRNEQAVGLLRTPEGRDRLTAQ